MADRLKEMLTVANVIKLATAVVAGVVFYLVAEMTQNERLATTVEAVNGLQKTTTAAFEKLDRNMTEQRDRRIEERREQRAFNTETIRQQAEMSTIQQQLKKENGRLADHAEKSTSAIVRITTIQQQLVKCVDDLKRTP